MKRSILITLFIITSLPFYSQTVVFRDNANNELSHDIIGSITIHYIVAFEKDAANADIPTGNNLKIDITGLPFTTNTNVELTITRISIGNPSVIIHQSNHATTASILNVTLSSSTLNHAGNAIGDNTGIFRIQLKTTSLTPNQTFSFSTNYLVIEKTKSVNIPGSIGYNFQIHFVDQFFQGRTGDINPYLVCLTNALNESWQKQINDWELARGLPGDIPRNYDDTYDLYISGYSYYILTGSNIVALFHKSGILPAGSNIKDFDNGIVKHERYIEIDCDPLNVNAFNANQTYITLQELVYEIVPHEFYHGIQWSHTSWNTDALQVDGNVLNMQWWFEGQAKALETVFMTDPSYNTKTNNIAYATMGNKTSLIHRFSYEVYVREFIKGALDVNYNYRAIQDNTQPDNGYYFALLWRHIYENHFNSGVPEKDRLEFFRETSIVHTSTTNNLSDIKSSIMNPSFTNVSGNFSNFDEALVDFAEKTYFHDNKWKNPDGTLIQNWDDPNSNNFYATISSYTPPTVNVIPSSNVITPVVSSINKSFAFRPHVFSFTNPGRYTFTFNGDDDGDNSTDTYHVKAYITENDIIFYNKDFVLTNGVGSLDDICIKNAAQELVLLVTRLDPDEATVNGEAYRISETIEASPVALFDANLSPTDSPFTIQFNDKSTGGIINWDWDFGDAQTATDQNPKHEYTTSGSYSVELEVNNCATSHSLLRDNYINILPPYIIEVNVSAEGEVKYQYSRTYNDASGFQFSSNGSYIREGKDIVVEVETSLPLVSLKLVMKNEKGEVVFNETKYSNLTGSSTNWTYNISKEVIGPRLNSLWFDGTEYSGIPLVNVKEPSAPPVFIDESAAGWSIDIPFITGIDNNYFIYVQTADNSGIEPIQLYQINNCNENRLVVINNSNDVHEVNFGDGSIETLNPYTFIDHKYGVGAEVYEMQISLNGKVIKTEAIHFAN